jgi:hypothetical protein
MNINKILEPQYASKKENSSKLLQETGKMHHFSSQFAVCLIGTRQQELHQTLQGNVGRH